MSFLNVSSDVEYPDLNLNIRRVNYGEAQLGS